MFGFRKMLQRDPAQIAAHRLYVSLVEQARRPAFYAALGVPDSIDGRFDLIALHAFLAMRRLRDGGEAGRAVAQALFDVMFGDMDQSLREMGVGDLGVGKRVKAMAAGFYGRVSAYEVALNTGDDGTALKAALARNLFGTTEPADDSLARIASYVRREAAALGQADIRAMTAGTIAFGPPPAPETAN